MKKVNRMIGLTRRTFHYMDQEVFRLLFTSLMRPHMDYADCIWSPHLKVDIAGKCTEKSDTIGTRP